MHTFQAFMNRLEYEEKTQGLPRVPERYPNVKDCYIYLASVAT